MTAWWRCPRCDYETDPGDHSEVTDDRDVHLSQMHPDELWTDTDLFVTSAAPVHYWWVCRQCFDMMARSAHPEVVERYRDRHITNRHCGWEPTETEAALVRWPPERATP